jgi:beta-lactamase class D
MKKLILFLCCLTLSVYSVFAAEGCFILKENSVVLKKEGDDRTRRSPCSSFKIFLALIGYDAGILKHELCPEWSYKPEYEAVLESWKDSKNPTSWIKNSCVWYSQILTQKLGMEKFDQYIKKFDYGNQDLSGDLGQNNGLTHAWLCSSL